MILQKKEGEKKIFFRCGSLIWILRRPLCPGSIDPSGRAWNLWIYRVGSGVLRCGQLLDGTPHGWKIDKEWITKTPGIVFALAMAVKAYTEPGDYILIQDPVYYPFREVIESNDRKVAANILIRKEDGSYAIDFEDFERQIVEKGVKLFLFCSPHNPVSRVWTREEVERLGDICLKHQVIIVSDEIHADFVFEGKHQVLVDLKDEYKDITVTCTSPGKTFNLAGLQISNIIIPNASLRKEFQHQVTAAGYSQVGAPGIFALIAAYTQGEEWYQAMKQYVKSNIDFLHTWMAEHLPQIKVTKTEGTYLVWMDFRAVRAFSTGTKRTDRR